MVEMKQNAIAEDSPAKPADSSDGFGRSANRNESPYAKPAGIVVLCVLFGFIVLLLGLSILSPDRSFSENENRSLASWPELSWSNLADGSFGKGVQSYVSDQFFGRDGWISLKMSEDLLKGVRESNGVYIGSDGYLIEKPEDPDMNDVDKNIDAINGFAAKYNDLSIQMAIVPNAACVLADRLPANAPVRDQRADLSMLSGKLSDKVHFIDVTDDLVQHKDEALYYHTDHHWTSLGASYAFLSMADDLGIENPISDYDIYTVTDSFEGTMASKSGSYDTKDTIEAYTPKDSGVDFYVSYEDTHETTTSLYVSSALLEKDKYTVFLGGNHPLTIIKTTNNNDRCLLIFKDSYANSFVQFITPYYEEIVLIDPRYYYENAASVIQTEDVTDVLFLYNLNTYLGDTSLCDVLNTAVNAGGGDASAMAEP